MTMGRVAKTMSISVSPLVYDQLLVAAKYLQCSPNALVSRWVGVQCVQLESTDAVPEWEKCGDAR